MIRTAGRIVAVLPAIALVGCGGAPADIGLADGRLTPCPPRPNCVASDAAGVWDGLKAVIADQPRTRAITANDRYLHAEAKSRVFGFVDDVEFLLRPDERLIAVRSASRVGYSDLGVNADRIEAIRAALETKALVSP